MSIATALTKLNTQRQALANNLTTKGVASAETETLSQLVPKVLDISGGVVVPTGDIRVRFIDYDGTTLQENFINSGDGVAPPANPLHIGLTFQGWNYASSAFSNITSNLDVGAMYITDNGRTRIKIRLTTISGLAVPVYLNKSDNKSTLTINWGDATSNTAIASAGNFSTTHTYAAIGDYTIEMWISLGTGTYGFSGGSATTTIIGGAVQNYRDTLLCINIGSGVTSIAAYAFNYCRSLTSITIPTSVTSIATYAFDNCLALSSITIPSSVTSIATYVFKNCLALTSITIPTSVTSIGDSTFYDCHSLTSITIPSGVTSIGAYAFSYCYILASITMPSGVTIIGASAFYYCNALPSITIPSSVTSIGDGAFDCCFALTSITIPSGVTSISAYAFNNCGTLASITIPSSVTSIGDSTFYGCVGVKYYNFEGVTVPTLFNIDVFTDILSITKIYVPDASVAAYKAALNWVTYANYIYPVSTKV